MLAIAILIIGIISRVIVHTPNFTPIIALSLFSGVYLSKRYAIWLPVVLMIASDLIIGWHNTIFFTWGSVALIAALGFWVKDKKSPVNILSSSIFASILFFVITNFGAWVVPGLYPPTLEGLKQCYIMAIPFFRTTLFSSVAYSILLFGIYELVAVRVKQTRFARVLLST